MHTGQVRLAEISIQHSAGYIAVSVVATWCMELGAQACLHMYYIIHKQYLHLILWSLAQTEAVTPSSANGRRTALQHKGYSVPVEPARRIQYAPGLLLKYDLIPGPLARRLVLAELRSCMYIVSI